MTGDSMNSDSIAEKPAEQKVAWWHLHRRLYNWVVGWADTPYGIPALIILALTEPIIVPIPADVLVVSLGLGNPKKALRYGLICSLFSVIGGTIAFALGLAIGGERVIEFFNMVHLGDKAAGALDLYSRYDFWAISIAALTPVPYMLFSWLGGMAEVSIVKFILISIFFRTIRFGSEGVLFYFFGQRARVLIDKYFNLATIVVMVLLVVVFVAIRAIGSQFG